MNVGFDRGLRAVLTQTTGAVSVAHASVLVVALVGMAGFASLGGAMDSAISGDGTGPSGAPQAPMAVSRQAGVENTAARFASELAKATEVIGAEKAAELTRQGAAIARKEHSLGRTPVSDIARNMRASDFLALDDWLWESVGKEGGLTPAEAHYWLGAATPKPVGVKIVASSLTSDGAQSLAERAARLAVVDDAPWLRFEAEHRSPVTDLQLRLLRATLDEKPFLSEGIARHYLALGFFDFGAADPALARLPFARVRRGLFFNVPPGQPFDMTRVLETIGNTVKELDAVAEQSPRAKGSPAFLAEHRVAPLADENLRAALEAVMPTNPTKSVQGWGYKRTQGDGAMDVMEDRALRHMAPLNPAYELLEDGSVPKFLAAYGFGEQALRLRETGTLLRVDAVDFSLLNTALHHRGEAVRASSQAAYYDVTTKHLVVNLAHGNLDSLPQLVADFVDLVVPKKP